VNFDPGVPRYHAATSTSPSLMHLFYNMCGFISQNRKCNMISIGETVAEIWRFLKTVSKLRPLAFLDF